jgi:hypothetical protein
MKRVLVLLFALLCTAASLFAVESDDCHGYQQLATLYAVRSVMLKPYSSSYDVNKIIDRQLDQLRGPQPDGSYRWVRWVRPSGDGPYDKHGHTVAAVNGSNSDRFEASGQHAFAVAVVVPQKKSLFSGNNPVYVGTVHVSFTVDGRTRTKDESINAWMNPDTSRTIDLGAIADRAEAALDASTNASNAKNALVEIHFRNAVAQDDPGNPGYDAIVSLQRVRNDTDAFAIDSEIARLESALFPDSSPIPLASVVKALRRADDLMRSKKAEDQEKGQKMLQEALRRLQ